MMHNTPIAVSTATVRRFRKGFTLTELLVAMGIIAIIGGITAIGIRNVAREARLSSAKNTVTAVLDNARAYAIRENSYVAVVFRARLEGSNDQYVEAVTARWTRESPTVLVSGNIQNVDRFVPVPGVASRRLPQGIKVGGALYHSSSDGGTDWDYAWGTQSNLLATSEAPGRVIGVMYAPDGTVVSRNSMSNAFRMYVDFNNDGLQQISNCSECPQGELNYHIAPALPSQTFRVDMMMQKLSEDEPLVTLVPFLAVFDDAAFRDAYEPALWLNDNWEQMRDDLAEYLSERADRLHFNRYTGVVMR